MRPLRRFLAAFLFLGLFTSLALAAAPPDPNTDTTKFAQSVLDAVKAKNWHLLAALALIGLVAGVRKLVPLVHGRFGAWLNTDRGGTLSVLTLGVLGAIGIALYGGAKVDLNLFVSGLAVGVTAAGGWNVVKKLFYPSDKASTNPHNAPTVPIEKIG